MSCAKMAEPIEVTLAVWTWVGQSKHVLDGVILRHLANTTEPSICDGDTAFLSNDFDHLLPTIH